MRLLLALIGAAFVDNIGHGFVLLVWLLLLLFSMKITRFLLF
jgi:hypothetical protein